jgi:hypothetical protein
MFAKMWRDSQVFVMLEARQYTYVRQRCGELKCAFAETIVNADA